MNYGLLITHNGETKTILNYLLGMREGEDENTLVGFMMRESCENCNIKNVVSKMTTSKRHAVADFIIDFRKKLKNS